MCDIVYTSTFKEHLKNHVELKQAVGYKYITEANHLKRFDKFVLKNYPNTTMLTKEIVLAWCSKQAHETQANQCSRASVIRQFAKYLDSLNITSYIIPEGYYPTGQQYIPHIYTTEELKNFFAETDKCKYCIQFPYRHLIMPILFRLVYSCGLRISEARLLKVGDVDVTTGIVTINNSKKDNSRLVIMSDSVRKRCQSFFEEVHTFSKPEGYFFQAIGGKPMTIQNIYKNFRRFLWKAGISHGGRGKGPRIHDFRHASIIHCLKKWVEQGKDLMVYLPVLRTYMGHVSFSETAYYLRLTADIFPNITLKLETQYPEIIPSLKDGDNYEA